MLSFADFLAVTFLWCAALFFIASVFLWSLGHRFRKEQNAQLYYPDEPSESRQICDMPEDHGISNAETIAIDTSDGVTLRGFLLWPGPVPSPLQAPSKAGSPDSSANGRPPVVVAQRLGSPGTSGAGGREGGTGPSSTVSTPSGSHHPSFVLIYFHGNAGNVGHRLPIAVGFTERLHCAVLMMDYRGFGLSDDAEVNQEGLEKDAQACLDFVLRDRRLPHDHIYVMGTSLGGAVTIHLAAKPQNARHIAAAIVENTFTSISDMASVFGQQVIQRAAPCPGAMLCLFEYYIKPLVLRIGWYSVRQVGSVAVPMLFLSGKKDELVPPAQMKRLYAAACASSRKKIRKFVEMPDGMHNNMPLMPGYFEAIQQFVNEVEQDRIVDVV